MGCVVLDFIWRKNQADLKFSTVLYRAILGEIRVAKIYDGKTCKAGETSRRVRQPSFKNGTNEFCDIASSFRMNHPRYIQNILCKSKESVTEMRKLIPY